MKNLNRDVIIDFIKMTIGCLIFAVGVSVFVQPNSIAMGGVSGLAIILNYVTDIPTGTLIIIFNIPLAILGLIKLGHYFMIKTIYVVMLSSVTMNFLEANVSFETEPLLGALFGGIIIGVGCGITFSVGASSGGMDIIAKVVRQKYPHFSLGQINLFIDIGIVTLSAVVFGSINSALYSAIVTYIMSRMVDAVIEGPDHAKMVYIISNNNDEIANEICNKLSRGATLLNGTGAYTKTDRSVIMCAVRRQQIPTVKKMVSSIDDNAFMIVTDVKEVLGYGFKLGGRSI